VLKELIAYLMVIGNWNAVIGENGNEKYELQIRVDKGVNEELHY